MDLSLRSLGLFTGYFKPRGVEAMRNDMLRGVCCYGPFVVFLFLDD